MSIYVRVNSVVSYNTNETTKEKVIKDIIDITEIEEFEIDAEGVDNEIGCVSLITELSVSNRYASKFTERDYIEEVMPKIKGCLCLSNKIKFLELEEEWDDETSCGEEIDEFGILYKF